MVLYNAALILRKRNKDKEWHADLSRHTWKSNIDSL